MRQRPQPLRLASDRDEASQFLYVHYLITFKSKLNPYRFYVSWMRGRIPAQFPSEILPPRGGAEELGRPTERDIPEGIMHQGNAQKLLAETYPAVTQAKDPA